MFQWGDMPGVQIDPEQIRLNLALFRAQLTERERVAFDEVFEREKTRFREWFDGFLQSELAALGSIEP